ncbi:MAG: LysR family transcriptional regulator [Gluconacetobacter diazotrophicus]|nr:LysR family transcriptional regulator [Gluconacetobacter diazotrophicus]
MRRNATGGSELENLALFEAIARTGSFTRAAALRGVSPSALSHAMRGLEERLGVRLLQRTTRSVSVTAEGEALLRTLQPALAGIEHGLAALAASKERPEGTLRITTFDWAARTVLQPRLPGFLARHPGVGVEVDVENGLVDIVAGGFDCGIRFGDGVERDMVAVRVGPDLRAVVVGTPDYLDRHGVPDTPAALRGHACLNYRLRSAGGLLPWEFERNGRPLAVRVAGPLVANDGTLLLAAVREGAGLGLAIESDVAAELDSGALVAVLGEWCPRFTGCHLFHPSRRQVKPALRALIAALRWRNPVFPPPLARAGPRT